MGSTTSTQQEDGSTNNGGGTDRNAVHVVAGLVLVVPAFAVLLTDHVRPTLWTFRSSFQDVSILGNDAPEDVGFENFDRLAETGVTEHIGFAFSLVLLPVLALLVAAPLLAYAAHRSGSIGRVLTRVALTLPMVAFAPSALAVGTRLDSAQPSGDNGRSELMRGLANPDTAPTVTMIVFGLTVFGLVLGWSVTGYLAAFRGGDAGHRVWPAVLAVGGLGIVGLVAFALQAFDFPLILTSGGPGSSTVTPMIGIYNVAFANSSLGVAAAGATVLLGLLMVLGVVAAVIVLLTRVRVEVASTRSENSGDTARRAPGRWIALVLAVLGLIGAAWVIVAGLRPWLSRITGDAPDVPDQVLANTWVPPLASAGIGVLLAVLAAYGIGALRPLGRYSELLLLPFAPWLFVGMGPFLVSGFLTARDAEKLNTFEGLTPPVSLVIPALFVCTPLFRGLRAHGHGRAVLWGLPAAALSGVVAWMTQAQSLGWPLVAGTEEKFLTGPVQAFRTLGEYATRPDIGLPYVYPLGFLMVSGVLFALAHVLYLDRLAIVVGRE